MECRMLQSDEPWTCNVSLRRNGVTEPFGKPIHKPSEVQGRIKKAQLAILHPTVSTGYFLKESRLMLLPKDSVLFSEDCVCVEISGPNIDDLSFFDLPG